MLSWSLACVSPIRADWSGCCLVQPHGRCRFQLNKDCPQELARVCARCSKILKTLWGERQRIRTCKLKRKSVAFAPAGSLLLGGSCRVAGCSRGWGDPASSSGDGASAETIRDDGRNRANTASQECTATAKSTRPVPNALRPKPRIIRQALTVRCPSL
jgi:hypothetical protein